MTRVYKRTDLTDEVYGEWTVIREGPQRGLSRYWLCQCSCGTIKEVSQGSLRSGPNGGSTKCVDCQHKSSLYGVTHRFYATALHILKKCSNKNDPKYSIYGGRGIKVHPLWIKKPMLITEYLARLWFKQFGQNDYTRYGVEADQYTVDRIDNDGHYEPDNLRFATKVQQTANRRIPINYREVQL